MDSRQFRLIAVLLGIIGAALLALVLVLVFSGDDEEPVATPVTTPAPAPATTPGPAATVPVTLPPTPVPPLPTQAPPPTTTVPLATTVAPTTTTTALLPTTTTTAPPPPGLVLQDDGIGGVSFGVDPDTAISYAESVLGPSDRDTGWVDAFSEFGTCPPPVVRGVEWGVAPGRFVLLFTEAATDWLPGGGQHLFGYYYSGEPAGLMTEGGISVGSSLGDAQAAHPGSTVDEHPLVVGSAIWKDDPDPGDDALLWGFAGGLGSGAPLASINGGVTCGE